MLQVQKTTGKKPKALEVPDPPQELMYLWEWFLQLFSGQPLTFSELHAWMQVTRTRVEPWEVEAIRSLERVLRSVQHGS